MNAILQGMDPEADVIGNGERYDEAVVVSTVYEGFIAESSSVDDTIYVATDDDTADRFDMDQDVFEFRKLKKRAVRIY